VTPAIRAEQAVISITQQSVFVLRADQPDICAMSAIAAGRAATWDVLLPTECDASVSAIAGFYVDSSFVNKHGNSPQFLTAKKQRRPQIFGTAGEFAPICASQKI
jgi:hypothetical protein